MLPMRRVSQLGAWFKQIGFLEQLLINLKIGVRTATCAGARAVTAEALASGAGACGLPLEPVLDVTRVNKLGLPFCGSGSPVHGCSTIGLAHSRNLLVSAAAHYLFKTTTRSLCQMRHPIALLLANTGPWLRSEKLRSQKTTPGGEFCPTDVYMLRGR